MAASTALLTRIWEFPHFVVGLALTLRMFVMVALLGGPPPPKKSLSAEEKKAEELGSKQAMATLWTWNTMVATGKGDSAIARMADCKLSVGVAAPDGIVHRFGTLEEVKLSSFFKPGRLTVLNFGSYT
eukprot:TRINITY_DN1933_c1_g1_i1.p3 TRINITY_DN1933_c1_g1~~TRINITY_DN1933_c1_g1_i1.p3  ORF type:complete len:128 (-),score=8.84 TRINITY_DN1933_c1_g1_i1:646-1029(-)